MKLFCLRYFILILYKTKPKIMNEEIEKLKLENLKLKLEKIKLKRRNLFLTIYMIVSFGIMFYNHFVI